MYHSYTKIYHELQATLVRRSDLKTKDLKNMVQLLKRCLLLTYSTACTDPVTVTALSGGANCPGGGSIQN